MGKELLCVRRAKEKYIKKYIKAYSLKLNKNTDSDMIVHLDSKEKYSVYIKQLIADDMKK